MSEPQITDQFRPEDQRAGKHLYQSGGVVLRIASDQAIGALVKQGTGYRVTLEASPLSLDLINATCSCSRGKKGRPCPHVAAAINGIEDKQPEFLIGRKQITFSTAEPVAPSAFQVAQTERRRAHADVQKERAREMRRTRRMESRGQEPIPDFPPEIAAALEYFKINGFDLAKNLTEATLREARTVLARVFHPDRGGAHQEMLELNDQFERVRAFVSLNL